MDIILHITNDYKYFLAVFWFFSETMYASVIMPAVPIFRWKHGKL